MSKHDLQARPIYHHKRESIEAHLSIVFAALAVSHWIEHQTGWSIKKFVQTLRRYRTVTIRAGNHTLTAADPLPADIQDVLATITTAQVRTSLIKVRSAPRRRHWHGRRCVDGAWTGFSRFCSAPAPPRMPGFHDVRCGTDCGIPSMRSLRTPLLNPGAPAHRFATTDLGEFLSKFTANADAPAQVRRGR